MKIYCIAGEASGDFIGSKLIHALQQDAPTCLIRGIGGDLMHAAGMPLFFEYHHIAVMGIFEIIPNLLALKKLIRATISDILNFKPDVIVTIDSPGFCNRVIAGVQKKLKNNAYQPKFVHYVAPSVWAWRPKRAKKLAQRVNHVLCLFDFEPAYFTKHGLKATHVGHPLVEIAWQHETQSHEGRDSPLLCILLGSRKSEIKRHAPLFQKIVQRFPDFQLVIPTFERFIEDLKSYFPHAILVTDVDMKRDFLMKSQMALAVSGTVSLELALSQTPAVIAYKTSALTAFLVQKLIKTPWVCLTNIMMKEMIVPEFLQGQCTVEALEKALRELKTSTRQDKVFFENIRVRLLPSASSKSPSQIASTIIKGYCN